MESWQGQAREFYGLPICVRELHDKCACFRCVGKKKLMTAEELARENEILRRKLERIKRYLEKLKEERRQQREGARGYLSDE